MIIIKYGFKTLTKVIDRRIGLNWFYHNYFIIIKLKFAVNQRI